MKVFRTPQWESNPVAEKTCKELFKKPSVGQKIKHKKKKNEKSAIKEGRIEKAKTKKLKSKIKNAKDITFSNKVNGSNPNELTSFNQNSNNKGRSDLVKNSSKVKKHKKQKLKNHDSNPQNAPMKHDKRIALDNGNNNKRPRKQKKNLTHQTLFNARSKLHKSTKSNINNTNIEKKN